MKWRIFHDEYTTGLAVVPRSVADPQLKSSRQRKQMAITITNDKNTSRKIITKQMSR